MTTEALAQEPIQAGDIVYVRNQSPGGKTVIEGRAQIASRVGTDRYRVRFDGDSATYTRFVVPAHRSRELTAEEQVVRLGDKSALDLFFDALSLEDQRTMAMRFVGWMSGASTRACTVRDEVAHFIHCQTRSLAASKAKEALA